MPEQDLNIVRKQILLNGTIDVLRLFCAHMADGAVDQLQAGPDGTPADLLYFVAVQFAFNMGICAEFQIDLIGIINGLLYQLRADKGGQVSADFTGERELAVGKCTGAGKAGGDVAVRLTVDTVTGMLFCTAALLDGQPLFDHDNLFVRAGSDQLQCSENAGRTGADDNDICFHNVSTLK